jgi:hypothetical protein
MLDNPLTIYNKQQEYYDQRAHFAALALWVGQILGSDDSDITKLIGEPPEFIDETVSNKDIEEDEWYLWAKENGYNVKKNGKGFSISTR